MKKKKRTIIRISFYLFLSLIIGFSIGCKKKHTHDWVEATCARPKVCRLCGETEGDTLKHVLGHWEIYEEPTCDTIGIKIEICPLCKEELTLARIDPLGHDLVHYEALEPTCTESGHTAYDACTRCDYTTIESIEPLNHDLVHYEALEPTCTESGHTAYDACTRCDYTTIESIEPLNHDLVHYEALEPTCTESGHTAYDACTRCDYTTYVELPSGHNWIEATYDYPKTCTRCGITEGEPLPYFHYKLTKNYLLLGERTRISIDNYISLEEFEISYSVNDIISIDEYGSIYAIGQGETTVTLSLINYPQRYISFHFEVLQKKPVIISNFTKMSLGDIATIYLKDSNDTMDQYDFSFENGQILETTIDNRLKAIGYGDEIITIYLKSDPRVSSTFYLSVVNKDTNLLIYSENENGLMEARAQMQMTNSLNLSNLDLTWGTSDKNIAIVSEKGVVTGISEGYVSVYAKNNATKEVINYYIKIEGIADVDYISRFIHLALDENGVHETDPTGSYPSSDNYQKYGEWYHNNGEPWCATFVSWCWHFSGLSTDLLCKYQGCTAGMKWCTEQGIMHYVQDFDFGDIEMENGASSKQYAQTYQPISGDIVFFLSSGMSHTGIVIYADDTYLYTIEGNTSDQVAIKRWSLNDARITGYASPKYPEYSKEREDFSWIKEEKEDGTYWWKPVTLVEKVD